jgi:hypothetical protein
VELHERERGVRFSERVVQAQRLANRRLGVGKNRRRHVAVPAKGEPAIRQPSVGKRVAGSLSMACWKNPIAFF